MSIYGAVHKVLKHFETHLFACETPSDKVTILQSIRTIWHDIEKYSKNIYPEKTAELSHIVHDIPTQDLAITKKMYEGAIPQFTRLKEAWSKEKEIKSFYSRLFRLLEELLLFNRDWEECCELCQGAMYYYIEECRQIVLKQCRSCEMFMMRKRTKGCRFVILMSCESPLEAISRTCSGPMNGFKQQKTGTSC